MRYTLAKQIVIAKSVQALQNAKYILFDLDFKSISTVMVGHYRVDVDAVGRRAILSAGAQACFTRDQYLRYVVLPTNAVVTNDTVYLDELYE